MLQWKVFECMWVKCIILFKHFLLIMKPIGLFELWLVDWIVLYSVSAIFKPPNVTSLSDQFWIFEVSPEALTSLIKIQWNGLLRAEGLLSLIRGTPFYFLSDGHYLLLKYLYNFL